MSERTIEEFLQARMELNKEIHNLLVKFEEDFSCRVTSIDAGEFIRIGRIGSSYGEMRRDSPPRVSVEF